MNENHLKYLQAALTAGCTVLWKGTHDYLFQIHRIEEKDEANERRGYLSRRGPSQYLDMWNVDPDDIRVFGGSLPWLDLAESE